MFVFVCLIFVFVCFIFVFVCFFCICLLQIIQLRACHNVCSGPAGKFWPLVLVLCLLACLRRPLVVVDRRRLVASFALSLASGSRRAQWAGRGAATTWKNWLPPWGESVSHPASSSLRELQPPAASQDALLHQVLFTLLGIYNLPGIGRAPYRGLWLELSLNPQPISPPS